VSGGERNVSEAALQHDGDLRTLADRLLETTRVEYVDEGVLLVMNPPGLEHRKITRSIVRSIHQASFVSETPLEWEVDSENFQWDLPDATRRFYVPDLVVIHPNATTREEEREAIALVVEVTSPTSPDTVLNDRETKPKQYAKGGIPLYLLVDQELGSWTLYALAEGWHRYQIFADGPYGEEIPLPKPFGFSIATSDWPRRRS
jgi:Uma2 family endonuclease